jgi:hypothetical protein
VEYNTTDTPACTPSVFQSIYNYGNSFYHFQAGLVSVVFLNPYSPSEIGSSQYDYVVDVLGGSGVNGIDRKLTPWVVVVMHCPWYNSNMAHSNEKQTVDMKKNLESLFYKYHVNIVISGHVHAYERSYPVFEGSVRTDGVTYVTIGDAGNHEG